MLCEERNLQVVQAKSRAEADTLPVRQQLSKDQDSPLEKTSV